MDGWMDGWMHSDRCAVTLQISEGFCWQDTHRGEGNDVLCNQQARACERFLAPHHSPYETLSVPYSLPSPTRSWNSSDKDTGIFGKHLHHVDDGHAAVQRKQRFGVWGSGDGSLGIHLSALHTSVGGCAVSVMILPREFRV